MVSLIHVLGTVLAPHLKELAFLPSFFVWNSCMTISSFTWDLLRSLDPNMRLKYSNSIMLINCIIMLIGFPGIDILLSYLYFAQPWFLILSLSFFFLHLYWSIIALQGCVSFCFITKWISYMYTYIPISPPSWASLPPSLSHPSRWSLSTELISLCYAAASHYKLAFFI